MASPVPQRQREGSDPPPPRKPSPDSPPKSATSSKFTTGPLGGHGSTKKLVVTVPPWAKHEQPVPDEDIFLSPITAYTNGTAANGSNLRSTSSHERMPSDIASFTSSAPEQAPSGNWWTFTVPRMIKPVISESHGEGRDGSVTPTSTSGDHDLEKAPRRRISKPRPSLKQMGRNRSSWIFGYALQTVGSNKGKEKRPEDVLQEENQDNTSSSSAVDAEDRSDQDEDEEDDDEDDDDADDDDEEHAGEARDNFDQAAGPSSVPERQKRRLRQGLSHRVSSNILRLDLPLPPAPFTKAQAETPGWDSPWNPRKWLTEPEQAHHPERRPSAEVNGGGTLTGPGLGTYPSRTSEATARGGGSKRKRSWKRRRRKFRQWCLHNLYVPLLFRMINLAFTSATLAVAIQTRKTEKRNEAMGILGSSSTVTIIFAPLTLVHVIVAIYLEYFGRPVGLWQTSAKLLHTLLEVVFICAWSASLALCFNDFFTTPLECGPASADRWWSDLPLMPNAVAERFQGTAEGRTLCREQLALICLAFVTLSSYCSNLVISLFRIIEKVKNYSRRGTYWN